MSHPALAGLQHIRAPFHESFRERWRRGGGRSHQQCLQCGLSEAWLGFTPSTRGGSSRARESRSEGEVLCRSRGGGWPGRSHIFVEPLLLCPPSSGRRQRRQRAPWESKKVDSYYGDCVGGLLWAELGDRLGLQLPGGAPLGRLPVAPLSRPSEFSNISWMRGGMEPGISIFRVMTRSAPAVKHGMMNF